MKAAVMYGVDQPLVLEEIDVDEPRRNEVLVRTSATGVCHSDLHFMEGKYPMQCPAVLGHESAGVVERVGEEVARVRPGDRVVIAFVASCGHCGNCIQGRPFLCLNTNRLGREDRLSMKGQPVTQFAGMAAFAEQQLVSEHALVPVPEGVPMDAAALVGCSVMTGVGAATNTARVQAGQTVAVVGCGGVGLNVIQGAVAAGASRVIAVDMLENKLAAAREFGATDVVDASAGDPVAQVKDLVRGGVDYAFEAIGLTATAEQCFEMAKRGGRAVIVGMLPFDSVVSLPGAAFLSEKGMIGSFYGSTRQTHDMAWLMELYRQGRLKIDELISRRYGLGEINEAYDALKNGEVNRSVILFE